METISIIGAFSALFIASLVLFYNAGRVASKVESLEVWRVEASKEMHEVSSSLEVIKIGLSNLETLIKERRDVERMGQ